MVWWADKAEALQDRVRNREAERGIDYADEDVRRATVHTREDIVLVVSLLSSVNRQLSTIKLLLVFLLAGVAWIAFKLSY